MTKARVRLTLLATLVSLTACGGASDGSAGGRATAPLEPTTRDSAGITIYEHPAEALAKAPLLTLDSTPLAVFAGDVDHPDLDVSAISWPIFLGSGDLIGYDRQSSSLLTLRTATGERVHRGRSGSGPAEIGFPGPLVLLGGDSVLFTDSQNDRIAIATPEAGIVRTITQSNVTGLRSSSILGRIGGGLGTYLLGVPGPPVDRQGMTEPREDTEMRHLGLWQVGADSVETRLRVPTRRVVRSTFPGGAWIHQLGLTPVTSIGVWGDEFFIARGERWLLERWDTGGRLKAVVRISIPPLIADDEIFHEWIEGDADRWVQILTHRGQTPNRDSIVAEARGRVHADTVAAYGEAHLSPNGIVWVTDYQVRPDSVWSATAITPDGRILGRIENIQGWPPIAWGDDRVAIRSEDADGIATITIRKVKGL